MAVDAERSKEVQRNLAGFVVAAGCVVFIVGLILVAGAFGAQNVWRGAVIPGDIQAIIDDGMRRGLAAIVFGLGLGVAGWLWHHDVAERRIG